MKYYDCGKTAERYPDADYYVIFGERSNGKTYSALRYCLKRYAENGEAFAYVRRYDEDIRPKYMKKLFDGHIKNGEFERIFSQRELVPNSYDVRTGTITLGRKDFIKGKLVSKYDDNPVCYLFSLSTWEHSKGVSFPEIHTIVFDEFLTRGNYLYDEVAVFSNLTSTLVRERGDVKIFMLGNTVSPYSPYFKEMGLTHVVDMKPGTVQRYHSSDDKMQYVIDYCESWKGGKESDKYFSLFDNPKLSMITKGVWETNQYPNIPVEYQKGDVVCPFYIIYGDETCRGDVMLHEDTVFLYFYRWTRTVLTPEGCRPGYESTVIYTDFTSPLWNVKHALTKHRDKLSVLIIQLLRENRAYYATNAVGELVRSYLIWSNNFSPLQ